MANKIVVGVWDCSYCGSDRISGELQVCPHCGKPLKESIAFCPYCGARLPVKTPQKETPREQPAQQQE